MLRIRRIHDAIYPANKRELLQVQEIIRAQFPGVKEEEILQLTEQLHNPLKYKFRAILLVADNHKGNVDAFALLFHAPDLNFCFLDFLATKKGFSGRGIGSILYEKVRSEAKKLNSVGLFFECLPDDPLLCRDPEILKENIRRFKFYESFGVTPITNTKYETLLNEGDDNPPYLMFDNLDKSENVLDLDIAIKIVKAILKRKYSDLCSEEYMKFVLDSFKDDPIQCRKPKYLKKTNHSSNFSVKDKQKIALIVNEKHYIHHVKERGYVEAPVRISSIMTELDKSNLFVKIKSRTFSEDYIKKVHDLDYFNYFKKVCASLPVGKSIYPYIFPIRNAKKPPKELDVCAGYYCIDTFTPINTNAFLAAKESVFCTLTGAKLLEDGQDIVYSLVRPPGHHAEKRAFGGFCYFNSAAISAEYLSKFGKIAILDIDYHHGNGQQDIFYNREDVFTVSIHGSPRFAYPYFSGFVDEVGVGVGEGFNVNYPLPESISYEEYKKTLIKAINKIKKYKPLYLIVSLGLDTAKGDPTGTWSFIAKNFEETGKLLGEMNLPTLVVQEGGYKTSNLGINAKSFFTGLWRSYYE
ncbi:MAG: acetylpolyamine amidohydrolase [Candidatus Margulisbacteria bacterium]|nr:acetylpolyamine amidohydrolase [Candidatus Margulisiibacteriota bacterium]